LVHVTAGAAHCAGDVQRVVQSAPLLPKLTQVQLSQSSAVVQLSNNVRSAASPASRVQLPPSSMASPVVDPAPSGVPASSPGVVPSHTHALVS